MNNNLLKDKYPEIFSEIDIEKTLEIFPDINLDALTASSSKKIFWKCEKGHVYQATVHKRTFGHNCIYCSGYKVLPGFNDIKTYIYNHPELKYILDDWDYNKNTILPENISKGSHQAIFFNCPNGHNYSMMLKNRFKGECCPYCSVPAKKLLKGFNDLETWCIKNNRFDIIDSWDYLKNNCSPSDILKGSHRKYWFKCKHGHSYQQEINTKVNKICGCPMCSNHKSIPELTIYEMCKTYIDSQVISGYRLNSFEIDIFLPLLNICVEYDGQRYHNSEESKIRENNKNISILEDPHNYTFIRIKETDNLDNLKRFKEISDNGLIIYYISNTYNNSYFQRLSEIIEEIFSFKISKSIIEKSFKSIKLQRG